MLANLCSLFTEYAKRLIALNHLHLSQSDGSHTIFMNIQYFVKLMVILQNIGSLKWL